MLPRLKPTSLRSTIDLLRQLDEIMSCWTDHQLHVFDSALISAQYMPVIRRNDLLTCSVFARLTSRTTCQISKVTVHHCRSSSQFLLSTLCEPLCVETKLLAKYVLYGATWHVKRKHVYCTEPFVCNTHGIQYTATVTALKATRSESAGRGFRAVATALSPLMKEQQQIPLQSGMETAVRLHPRGLSETNLHRISLQAENLSWLQTQHLRGIANVSPLIRSTLKRLHAGVPESVLSNADPSYGGSLRPGRHTASASRLGNPAPSAPLSTGGFAKSPLEEKPTSHHHFGPSPHASTNTTQQSAKKRHTSVQLPPLATKMRNLVSGESKGSQANDIDMSDIAPGFNHTAGGQDANSRRPHRARAAFAAAELECKVRDRSFTERIGHSCCESLCTSTQRVIVFMLVHRTMQALVTLPEAANESDQYEIKQLVHRVLSDADDSDDGGIDDPVAERAAMFPTLVALDRRALRHLHREIRASREHMAKVRQTGSGDISSIFGRLSARSRALSIYCVSDTVK